MNAAPMLIRVARVLRETNLGAVMIGNAAAALQGAPVTTIDVDFLFQNAGKSAEVEEGGGKTWSRALQAVLSAR